MRLRAVLIGTLSIGILLVLAGLAWTWRSAIEPISSGAKPVADAKTIRLGAELATIGNCSDCHTTKSGAPYAGGRALDANPYGTIYSSNITPDPETGIGKWSEEAFRRAMHEGVDREGRHLYPAFPYDHFTHATDQDLHALYAFLMSQQAVRSTVPSNDLKFPFNIRLLVAGWKILFLSRGSLEPDSSQSPEWNRGRYLVEGLGHCSSCHTPRNLFGAEKKYSAYAGAVVDGWYGPSLNSSIFASHKWSADQLAEYLSTGWHKMHGAAAGPMSDVAKNLSRASRENVDAMAIYIASLSNDPKAPTAPAQDKPVVNATSEVVAIYTGACAKCHNDRNDVGPSKALPLSLSTAVHQADSANAVRAILYGIEAYRGSGGPYMPAFDGILTDSQIASVAEYVRARYSGGPQWTDINKEITKARQKGGQP
jgi:mono/diheme cytochrome c family protein